MAACEKTAWCLVKTLFSGSVIPAQAGIQTAELASRQCGHDRTRPPAIDQRLIHNDNDTGDIVA